MECSKENLFNNFVLNMTEEGVRKSRINKRIQRQIRSYINYNFNKPDFENKLVRFAHVMIKKCKEEKLSTPCDICGGPLTTFKKEWKDWNQRKSHKKCYLGK